MQLLDNLIYLEIFILVNNYKILNFFWLEN